MNEVSQRIERIRSIFLDTQLFYANDPTTGSLLNYLENIEPQFRSIAYESASMAIALKDLEKDHALNTWIFFASGPALAHKAQVYVGLGWAISKLDLPFLTVIKKIETRYYHRIADGCGYYDGSFKQRQTVLSQLHPVYLPEEALPIYDQGIGRSLWYTNNADINKIRDKIDRFPANRQADLWRGIGIAVAYVGGCEDAALFTLLQYAGNNRIQLACGAALVARSRLEANTMTVDTDHCSRLWFNHTADDENIFLSEKPDPATIGNEEVYFNWITQIEDGLAGSFELKS